MFFDLRLFATFGLPTPTQPSPGNGHTMAGERASTPLIGGVTLLERATNYTFGCLCSVRSLSPKPIAPPASPLPLTYRRRPARVTG